MIALSEDLVYQIGLTLINGIGDVNAKALLAYCGSPSEVFKQRKTLLQKIPGIGEVLAKSIAGSLPVLKKAEAEIKFIEKYQIKPLFFTDPDYPYRLKHCADGPIIIYYKGNADLNAEKILGVVGTRRPSKYGIDKTEELISGLAGSNILILSGLAYGVDVLAHKTALENDLNTVGVVGHGLDRIYPSTHDKIAKRMLRSGGLITEFMSGTVPDAVNFPKRNRIVAGMCDALVVIESKRTGGSLITATIAQSYNRDVFALPGRAGEALAEGCNGLIKRNKASLVESAADVLYAMQWLEEEKKPRSRQIPLMIALSAEEKPVMNLFAEKKSIHIDEICHTMQLPVSRISPILLQLEFNNLIKSRPGKIYERM
jgi:DNA processing protein